MTKTEKTALNADWGNNQGNQHGVTDSIKFKTKL